MARTPKTPTEPTDDELLGSEPKTPDAPKVDPNTQLGGKPIGQLSGEEILKLLEQRRSELSQLNSVAKEKGVKVPTKSKPKVSDSDRLIEFFNRVGYSTGMKWWAESRVTTNLKRIAPVVTALGEGWDPEKHGEAVAAMVKGFVEARVQTSFPSTSMPDKKSATDVPESEVWVELQEKLRNGELPDFLAAMMDGGE